MMTPHTTQFFTEKKDEYEAIYCKINGNSLKYMLFKYYENDNKLVEYSFSTHGYALDSVEASNHILRERFGLNVRLTVVDDLIYVCNTKCVVYKTDHYGLMIDTKTGEFLNTDIDKWKLGEGRLFKKIMKDSVYSKHCW